MSSRRRSKRLSRELENSVMKDFIELRDAGGIQTRSKRRRTKERAPSKSTVPPSILKDINDLRRGAFEIGDVTPHPDPVLHLTFKSPDPNPISETTLTSSKPASPLLSSPVPSVSTTIPHNPSHVTSTPSGSPHYQTTQPFDTASSQHLSFEPVDTDSSIHSTSMPPGSSSAIQQITTPPVSTLLPHHNSTPPHSTRSLHHTATPHNPATSLSSSPSHSTRSLRQTATPRNPAVFMSSTSTSRSTRSLRHAATPHNPATSLSSTSISHDPATSLSSTSKPHNPATARSSTSTPHNPATSLSSTSTPHNPATSLSSTSTPHNPATALNSASTPHNPATSLSSNSSSRNPATTLSSTSIPLRNTRSLCQNTTPSNPTSSNSSTPTLLHKAHSFHEIVTPPDSTTSGVTPSHNTHSLHQTATPADPVVSLSQSSTLPSSTNSLHQSSFHQTCTSPTSNTSVHLSTSPPTSLNSNLMHLSTHSSRLTSTPIDSGTTLCPISSPNKSLAIGTPMTLRSVLRTKSSSQMQPNRSVSFHSFVAVKEFNPTCPTQGTSEQEIGQEDKQQWEPDELNDWDTWETRQMTRLHTNEEQSALEDDVLIDSAVKSRIPLHDDMREEEEEDDDDNDVDDDEQETSTLASVPGNASLPLTRHSNRKDKRALKAGGHAEQNRRQGNQISSLNLSRSVLRNLFQHQSRFRVSKEAINVIMKFSQLYLNQVAEDLAAYAQHAGRQTLEVEDAVLLLRRQRFLSDKRSFEYLVNSQLPLEYVQQLLPCAQSGKKIVP